LNQNNSPSKKARLGLKVIQASRLDDLSFVVALLGLDYHHTEFYLWQEPEGPEVHLSEDAGMLLLFLDA
jgi:hypothetical protein